MILTLDTTFLVLHYLSNEPETLKRTRQILIECRKLGNKGLLPTMVTGEFYAQTHRIAGREVAEKYFREIANSGLTVLSLNIETSRQSAIFRRKYQEKIPWGDCIIAATAFLNQSEFILTEDRHFKLIKEVKSRRLLELVP